MKKAILAVIVLFTSQLVLAQSVSAENLKIEKKYLEIADVLATNHNAHGPCGGEMEAYTSEIVDSVQKARFYFDNNWSYNQATGRKFKISKETTKAMKTTLALKDVMNMLDDKDPKTYEHALNRVIMWGPAPGVFGNMSYIEFHKDNKATINRLDFVGGEFEPVWNDTPAIFEVQKDSKYGMILVINSLEGEKKYILRSYYQTFQNQEWNMVPLSNPKASPYLNGFVDYPSECEA